MKELTCIEAERIGAIRSSFPSLATLWWTLTSALISLDCNNDWRNCNSCSPDNLLSASLRDVSNFDKTGHMKKLKYRILIKHKCRHEWRNYGDTREMNIQWNKIGLTNFFSQEQFLLFLYTACWCQKYMKIDMLMREYW